MTINNLEEFKKTLTEILKTAFTGVSNYHHFKLQALMGCCNAMDIRCAVATLPMDASVYLGPDGATYLKIVNAFRRMKDHPCSRLADIAYFSDCSTLVNLVKDLGIPYPDTTMILMNFSQQEEAVAYHLVNLVSCNEDPSKCLTYISDNFTLSDFYCGLDRCLNLIKSRLRGCHIDAGIVDQINNLFGDTNNVAVNYLAQFAIIAMQREDYVTRLITWLKRQIAPVELSVATSMVAMHQMKTAICGIIKPCTKLDTFQFRWILSNCAPIVVRFCLEERSVYITPAAIQAAFDHCVANNSLNQFTADILLSSTNVICHCEHLTSVAAFCNIPLMQLILPKCRKWSPVDLIGAMRRADLNYVPQQERSKLISLLWDIFQKDTDISMFEDVTHYSAISKRLVVTRAGQLERGCKK